MSALQWRDQCQSLFTQILQSLDKDAITVDVNIHQLGDISRASVSLTHDIEILVASKDDIVAEDIENLLKYFLDMSGIVSLTGNFREILAEMLRLLVQLQENSIDYSAMEIETTIEEQKDLKFSSLILFYLQFCYLLSVSSPLIKASLHSFDIMKNILTLLNTSYTTKTNKVDSLLFKFLKNLFVALAELGISHREMQFLCENIKETEESDWFSIFQEMFQLYDLQYKSLLMEPSSQLRFDKLKLNGIMHGFTLQTWLKFNIGPIDPLKHSPQNSSNTIFSIRDDNNNSVVDYRLLGSCLVAYMVGVGNSSPAASHTFEEFEFEHGKLYHIVIVHKSNTTSSYSIDLFINGSYIDSYITTFPLLKNDTKSKANHLSLVIQNNSMSYNILEVINVLLINRCQKLEWILLSYYLGPLYSGDYQDKNIYFNLNHDSKIDISLKLQESNEQYGHEFIESELSSMSLETLERSHSFSSSIEDILLNFHSSEVEVLDDQDLVLINQHTSPGYRRLIISQEKVHYWNPLLLESCLNSLGGYSIFLSFIENARTTDFILGAMKTLFTLLSHHSDLLVEFETNNGYDILATLLKKKKRLIQISILDEVLKFVGYDFNCPSDSILKNILAYKSLIADFEIWNGAEQKDHNSTISSLKSANETFKFLIFQFTVFGQDSRYHSYNITRLMRMRIIKRIVQALKLGCFDKEVLPVLHDSLLILLRSNPTTENLRSVSLYILYALNSKDKENQEIHHKSGAIALNVLSMIVSESLSPTSPVQKKILKCINVRWILLLFQSKDPVILQEALRLLFQVLQAMDYKHYKQFMEPIGLTVLSSFLKYYWMEDEICMLIFGAIFGVQYTPEMGQDFSEFVTNISRRGSSLQMPMPEFFFIFNNITNEVLEWFADYANKERSYTDGKYAKAIKFLESYLAVLEVGCQKIKSLKFLSHNNTRWISEGLGILLKLDYIDHLIEDKSISKLYSRVKSFYSSVFLQMIFSAEKHNKKPIIFIEALASHSKTASIAISSIVCPTILEHYKIHCDELPSDVNQSQLYITIGKLAHHYLESHKLVEWPLENYEKAISIGGFLIEKDSNSGIFAEDRSLQANVLHSFATLFVSYFAKLMPTDNLVDEELTKAKLEKCYSLFMMNQHLLFFKVLTDESVAFLVCSFCVHIVPNRIAELSLNSLRMCIMQVEPRIKSIAKCICKDTEVQASLSKFLLDSVSTNDEEILVKLSGDFHDILNPMKFYYNQNIKQLTTDLNKVHMSTLVKVPLGHNKNLDESIKKILKHEIIPLTNAVITYEEKRFNRHNQDSIDDAKFYNALYHSIKTASPIGNFAVDWILDSAEGPERMRTKIYPEPYEVVTNEVDGDQKTLGNASVNVAPGNSEESGTDDILNDFTDSFEAETEVIHEDKNRKVLKSLFVGDKISKMFNTTQILGLNAVETLMIIGITHLYLIENYFYNSSGDIIDIDDAPMELRDQYMHLVVQNSVPLATPSENSNSPASTRPQLKEDRKHRIKSWDITRLVSVSKRQFLLREVSIELFFMDGSNVLIACRNKETRDKLAAQLSSKITSKLPDEDLSKALQLAASSTNIAAAANSNNGNNGSGSAFSFSSKLANAFASTQRLTSFEATKKWCKGELSNFYYLMILNTIAGRTFNDLTQYPVFPWVIADYTSEELDLSKPETFRDLSKPMGSQTQARANQFKERYEASEGIGAPPFHYGTHYSSSMVVSSYLIRLKPFIDSYLILQGGKLDHADRLFTSIPKAWTSASRDNTADVRELIPEFFYLPEFLINSNKFELGRMQDGSMVDNVELPPWAKGDPKIFIQKNREALESEYVSKHLHEWVDLIFGFRQQGKRAIESLNVFNSLSYHGAIDLDTIKDEHEKHVITSIIHNFGQTPLQIFKTAHPQRTNFDVLDFDCDMMLDLPLTIVESDRKVPVERMEVDPVSKEWIGRTMLHAVDNNLALDFVKDSGTYKVNDILFESFNASKVSSISLLGDLTFAAGCNNGLIHIYKLWNSKSMNITNARIASASLTDSTIGSSTNIERIGILRGHFKEIKNILVSTAYKLILSLDLEGKVILWDSIKLVKLRVIANDCNLIGVCNETGKIVTVSNDNTMQIFTINGDLVATKKLIDNDNPSNKLTCISVGELDPKTHKFCLRDMVIAVGWSQRSTVSLHELKLTSSGWLIDDMRFFRNIAIPLVKITAIKLKFKIELDFEGKEVIKSELVAGDKTGKLMIWR